MKGVVSLAGPWWLALLLAIFVGCAASFKLFGPLCGSYDFSSSLVVLFDELNSDGWLVLIVLLCGVVCAYPSKFVEHMRAPDAGRLFTQMPLVFLIVLFFSIYWGGVAWWNVVSMCLVLSFVVWLSSWRCFVLHSLYCLVGYLLVGYAFTILKASVFLRGVAYDGVLVEFDEFIFGVDIYKIVASWAQLSHVRMRVADWVYMQLFGFMLFNLLACAYIGGGVLVRRYGLAMLFCYVFGVVIYIVVPAYGPFVYDSAVYQYGWSNGGWRVSEIQRFILSNTRDVGLCGSGSIAPFAYVAAMPSLHVAVPALGGAMLWHNRKAFVVALVPLVLTIYAVMATGMHYGVDVAAGLVLAYGSARLACRLRLA